MKQTFELRRPPLRRYDPLVIGLCLGAACLLLIAVTGSVLGSAMFAAFAGVFVWYAQGSKPQPPHVITCESTGVTINDKPLTHEVEIWRQGITLFIGSRVLVLHPSERPDLDELRRAIGQSVREGQARNQGEPPPELQRARRGSTE